MKTHKQSRSVVVQGLLACVGAVAAVGSASAGDEPTMLQWFELGWRDMEHRMPDFFLAGYGSVWVPPVSKANAQGSAGYDLFDRFDLGSPGSETAYGTLSDFQAAIDAFHDANATVYVDLIMNHNSFRRTDQGFHDDGGYPGFWANPPGGRDLVPTDDWGDFHNSPFPNNYQQSENPNGQFYNLFDGDLVALIDIDQFSQNFFIRQPTDANNPSNIPAGLLRNLPDPGNAVFYQDRNQSPEILNNPGTFRNPGATVHVRYPFNLTTPMAGTPILENASDYLVRHTQWMLDVVGVDGFRLDAAKHIPSLWWDKSWDNAVYNHWRHPSGVMVTPFSFSEAVDGNSFIYDQYTRKPNNTVRFGDEWGNRDALDLSGAGALRDLQNAGGFGSWLNVLNAHLDNADGFNDGSLGVNHVFSHDNGSVGDGGSPPALPTMQQMDLPEHAYLILRPGQAVVYHNAQGISRPNGFWPRQGIPLALGREPVSDAADSTITGLVRIANEYGRGDIDVTGFTDPVVPNIDDVMVFERRQPGGPANVLVAVNDRRDPGVQTRNVATNFAPGTRLHELTGNAADPMVDPSGQVPEVIVVDGSQRVTVTVPNNVSTAGAHERGFVVYGPALPSGTLTVSGVTGQLPDDPFFFPDYFRRINTIDIVQGPFVNLQLTTTQTDPLDPNTDDNALFKFGQGYLDLNGNGAVDFPTGMSDTNGNGVLEYPSEQTLTGGFEQFLTINSPLFGGGSGTYMQTIDTSMLEDGFQYITVLAFRHRDDGGDPIFAEFRKVIYLDNEDPGLEIVDPPMTLNTGTHTFDLRALDRTTTDIVLMLDLPNGTDPVAEAKTRPPAARVDRFDWTSTLVGMSHGYHTVTAVALEESGRGGVVTHTFFVDTCLADVNKDGVATPGDFTAWIAAFNAGDPNADQNGDGVIDPSDFTAWIANFNAGC